MSKEQVGFRLEPEQLERLDKLAEALTKRTAGVTVNRSSAARAALDRGIEELEKDIGLAAKGTKPPSKAKK